MVAGPLCKEQLCIHPSLFPSVASRGAIVLRETLPNDILRTQFAGSGAGGLPPERYTCVADLDGCVALDEKGCGS